MVFHGLFHTAGRMTHPMKRSAGERWRFPSRGGQRLPDVVLRGPGRVAVPHRQGPGSRPVPYGAVPAGAPPTISSPTTRSPALSRPPSRRRRIR